MQISYDSKTDTLSFWFDGHKGEVEDGYSHQMPVRFYLDEYARPAGFTVVGLKRGLNAAPLSPGLLRPRRVAG